MFYTYSINDRSKGWKGWLEQKTANGDPYKIAARIIKTVNSVIIKKQQPKVSLLAMTLFINA
jgi:hypothetical protein